MGPFGDIKNFSQKNENENFEQCHSAEKCKRGTLSGFLNINSVAKNEEGALWFNPKISKNSLIVPRITRRERLKSAPYLRLKNRKKISKCQVFSSTVHTKPKSLTELARPSGFFAIHSVAKNQKHEAGPFEDNKHISKKSLTMPKK